MLTFRLKKDDGDVKIVKVGAELWLKSSEFLRAFFSERWHQKSDDLVYEMDDHHACLDLVIQINNLLLTESAYEALKVLKAKWSVELVCEHLKFVDFLMLDVDKFFGRGGRQIHSMLNVRCEAGASRRLMAIMREVTGNIAAELWTFWFKSYAINLNSTSLVFNLGRLAEKLRSDSAIQLAATNVEELPFQSLLEVIPSIVEGNVLTVIDLDDKSVELPASSPKMEFLGCDRVVPFRLNDEPLLLFAKLSERYGVAYKTLGSPKRSLPSTCDHIITSGVAKGLRCCAQSHPYMFDLVMPLCQTHINKTFETLLIVSDKQGFEIKIPCLYDTANVIIPDVDSFKRAYLASPLQVEEEATSQLLFKFFAGASIHSKELNAEFLNVIETKILPWTSMKNLVEMTTSGNFGGVNRATFIDYVKRYGAVPKLFRLTIAHKNLLEFVTGCDEYVLGVMYGNPLFPFIIKADEIIGHVGHLVFTEKQYSSAIYRRGQYIVTGVSYLMPELVRSRKCAFHKNCKRRLFTSDGVIWGCEFPIKPSCEGDVENPNINGQIKCTCEEI